MAEQSIIAKSGWDFRGCAWAIAIVVATTSIGWPLYHRFGIANENILMLYLLGVVWVAVHQSRSAAAVAAVLAVVAFDITFVKPYYSFAVSDQQYLVTFGVMLATALVISALTFRVRAQTQAARDRERHTATLYALSRALAAARTIDEIVVATVRQVTDVLGLRTILLLPDHEKRLVVKGDSEQAESVEERDRCVAQRVFEHGLAAEETATSAPTRFELAPLKGPRGAVGVIGVLRSGQEWRPEQRQLLEGLAAQAAMALERATLIEEARVAWERVEAEFLRNTLLSGVSHELRTPLAAITGAVSTLIETGTQLSPEARDEMLDTIYGEAERMERLITNLLDMSRLESGATMKKEWQPLQEVVGSALRRLDRRLTGRRVTTSVADDLPLVEIDGVLIEQVLINLLNNAIEYTPPSTQIHLTARRTKDAVEVSVSDDGPGLPPGSEDRVFQKFFRAGVAANQRGIGLGLAVCRGIIEGHGGRISGRNQSNGGAAFQFTIPSSTPPPTLHDRPDNLLAHTTTRT